MTTQKMFKRSVFSTSIKVTYSFTDAVVYIMICYVFACSLYSTNENKLLCIVQKRRIQCI